MTDNPLLDLYTDYLISSFGPTTATGLANLLGPSVSHDQVTRFLSAAVATPQDLWKVVKPWVRQIHSPDAVLIVDDRIEEKPYTDENDLLCWHYDHSHDRKVKGINFLTALYQAQAVALPVSFDFVTKTAGTVNKKTGTPKRISTKTKNERFCDLVRAGQQNHLLFNYVLADSWYASADNFRFLKLDLKKDLIMPLKSHRKVAWSRQEKTQGKYVRLDSLAVEENRVREIYVEQVDFRLLLAKQVFTNEDGSHGVLYLVSSDLTLTDEQMTTIYQKRWQVEEYHKSLKQNASLEKSPTRRVTTQSNHFFASLCAYIKLESLKVKTQLNHFALQSKIYQAALQAAFTELRKLHPQSLVQATPA